MTKKTLDYSDIGAGFEQVRGERMAQGHILPDDELTW